MSTQKIVYLLFSQVNRLGIVSWSSTSLSRYSLRCNSCSQIKVSHEGDVFVYIYSHKSRAVYPTLPPDSFFLISRSDVNVFRFYLLLGTAQPFMGGSNSSRKLEMSIATGTFYRALITHAWHVYFFKFPLNMWRTFK